MKGTGTLMPALAFRLAIRAEDGCRSGIWRVWSPNKTSDVYIACREMKGDFKISLHERGDCQAGFTQEYERQLRAHGEWTDSRHIEKWKLERPVKESVLAIRVLIPVSELRRLTGALKASKPVHWIPGPPRDHTVSVEIALANAGLEFAEASRPAILSRWELPSAEAVRIGYRVEPTPDSINDAIADHRSRQGTKLDGRRDWDRNHPEGRILIFGPNEGGWRSFLDIAATPLASP